MLPQCNTPALCEQQLCWQTPQFLSLWDNPGHPSPQWPAQPVQTGKRPGKRCHSRNHKKQGDCFQQWSWKALVPLTCSSSSLVTTGSRFRTVSAALWTGIRILMGRSLITFPSNSALAISASVRVSCKNNATITECRSPGETGEWLGQICLKCMNERMNEAVRHFTVQTNKLECALNNTLWQYGIKEERKYS